MTGVQMTGVQMKSLVGFFILFGASMARAESVVESLKASGFQCVDRGPADICVIRKVKSASLNFEYDLPIVVAVPKAQGQLVERPERVLLHLHGFRGVCRSSDGTPDSEATPEGLLKNFALVSQMNALPEVANSILVMPISKYRHGGGYNPYASILVPRFTTFTKWVESVANAQGAKWAVSGHSAAGSIISRALSQNTKAMSKVESITMFDAAYGMPNRIDEWRAIARANPRVRIQTVSGSGTAKGSSLLKSSLSKSGLRVPVKYTYAEERHCAIPNLYFASTLRDGISR